MKEIYRAGLFVSVVRMAVILPFFLVGLWACPEGPTTPVTDGGDASKPAPVPPPVPTAVPPSSACADACTTLARIGCKQGAVPTCASDMQTIERNKLVIKPGKDAGLLCSDLVNARTQADVLALGASCTL